MKTDWKNCIVILIDLIGIQKQAQNSKGSVVMQKFHQKVLTEIDSGNYSFYHVYVYNDAVLALSLIDNEKESFQNAMEDADKLKKKIDQVQKSYAIAVKGQVFPTINSESKNNLTIIKTSSWAMANCFKIEAEMKKHKVNKSWYVDGRIARKIKTHQESRKHLVELHPSGKKRNVHSYDNYLWND